MARVLQVANAPGELTVDGFGARTTGIDPEHGNRVDLLELAPELVENAAFVSALAERVARFAAVRHTSYVHLRRIDRPSPDRLNLVSDHTAGWRLSELLAASHADGLAVDITILIGLMRQLLPAVALYSRHNRDAAIGSIGVERLIVTPQARLVIAEHAFGPALDKLQADPQRLWRDYRVVMPVASGAARSDQRGDAMAVGTVALALLLGRPLEDDDYPSGLRSLLGGGVSDTGGGPTRFRICARQRSRLRHHVEDARRMGDEGRRPDRCRTRAGPGSGVGIGGR